MNIEDEITGKGPPRYIGKHMVSKLRLRSSHYVASEIEVILKKPRLTNPSLVNKRRF
jgi:hypothetical protein